MSDELHAWALRHGISYQALHDLIAMVGAGDSALPVIAHGDAEARVQADIRAEASRIGWRLWRNNSGAEVIRGQMVRWGLCNDSARVNKQIKSSDLIGIKPNGQFVAREVKAPGWKFTGTEREHAQMRFLVLVTGMGGDAKFCSSKEELE